MSLTTAILAVVLIISVAFAQPAPKTRVTKEQATKTALEHIKGGTIESSELEKEDGRLVWSFDIKSGSEVKEVWIDANTGVFIKIETESAAKEVDEKAMERAEKVALKKVPGAVVKKEAEDKKGKPFYEFEIETKDGKVVEVEVDAKTNKVVRVEKAENESEEHEGGEKK